MTFFPNSIPELEVVTTNGGGMSRRTFYSSGHLESEKFFTLGKESGTWREWFSNGNRRSLINKDRPFWKYWNLDGDLIFEM